MNTGNFPFELRSRVIAAIDNGMSCRKAAKTFSVSPAACIRWYKAWKEEGRIHPLQVGGDRRSHRIEEWADAIFSHIAQKPDITLHELRNELKSSGFEVAVSTLHRFFVRHGVT